MQSPNISQHGWLKATFKCGKSDPFTLRGFVLATNPHQHQSSLQAGFAMGSGVESNAPVLSVGADTDRYLGRRAQLDFLPTPILIYFYFGNVDRTVDQGA
jgi:hypothetical protein